MKMCYACNKKAEKFPEGYRVVNNLTGQTVAYFCSEKCLRKLLPFAKLEIESVEGQDRKLTIKGTMKK